jgi:hypothetical protein
VYWKRHVAENSDTTSNGGGVLKFVTEPYTAQDICRVLRYEGGGVKKPKSALRNLRTFLTLKLIRWICFVGKRNDDDDNWSKLVADLVSFHCNLQNLVKMTSTIGPPLEVRPGPFVLLLFRTGMGKKGRVKSNPHSKIDPIMPVYWKFACWSSL